MRCFPWLIKALQAGLTNILYVITYNISYYSSYRYYMHELLVMRLTFCSWPASFQYETNVAIKGNPKCQVYLQKYIILMTSNFVYATTR